MTVADIAFYAFAIVVVTAGLFVVVSKNPVHSVLWLILAFLSSAGMFVLLGAEFVAMLLVIVYVGAVAVLFLFVVMMLDIDFAALKAEMARYVPLAGLIGVILLLELGMVFGAWATADGVEMLARPEAGEVHNTRALGLLIYDDYIYLFQAAGLILLVAMIGAIVLTLRHKEGVKRQSVTAQVGRDRKTAIEMLDIKPGQGIGE